MAVDPGSNRLRSIIVRVSSPSDACNVDDRPKARPKEVICVIGHSNSTSTGWRESCFTRHGICPPIARLASRNSHPMGLRETNQQSKQGIPLLLAPQRRMCRTHVDVSFQFSVCSLIPPSPSGLVFWIPAKERIRHLLTEHN